MLENLVRSSLQSSLDDLLVELSQEDIRARRQAVYRELIEELGVRDPSAATRVRNDYSAGYWGEFSPLAGLVDPYLLAQGQALTHQFGTLANGNELFQFYWKQVQGKVCEEYEYCNKRKEHGDDGRFLATIAALIAKDFGWSEKVCVCVLVAAFYMGPRFICDCSEESSS